MDNSDLTKLASKVWESHENPDYREDQSHWRGVGRWKDDYKWQSVGQGTLKLLKLIPDFKFNISSGQKMNFLEWGPGGGSNVLALRRFADSYYGVDISEKNLNECSRMSKSEGFDGFRPVLLTGSPSSLVECNISTIDCFVSTACFQHFPSKEYGEEVLKIIASRMSNGGSGLIQIRYDNGNPRFAPIASPEEYEKKHLTANSYEIGEFWDLLKSCGFKVVGIPQISSQSNYVWYIFQRP